MHRDRIEFESVQRWRAQRNDTFGTDDSQSETPVVTGTVTPLPKSETYGLEHFQTPELTTV